MLLRIPLRFFPPRPRLLPRVPLPTATATSRNFSTTSTYSITNQNESQKRPRVEKETEIDFKPLDIVKSRAQQRGPRRKKREPKELPPPRHLKLSTTVDWGSVWPTARTFHPATVPLPLHQGYVKDPTRTAAPDKYGNLELMKIPNFLHLTPPVIARQCEALKKFCTPWPHQLKKDTVIDELFPIQITTSDYCHSMPSIRDARSRIVNLEIPLHCLHLSHHAKDKLLRLVGELYNSKEDKLTITTDVCPLRQQNYDYAMYLLTAVVSEARDKAEWESSKELSDMEEYVWEGSVSEKTLKSIGEFETSLISSYRDAVVDLHNDGEDIEAVENYGKSVKQLLNLPV